MLVEVGQAVYNDLRLLCCRRVVQPDELAPVNSFLEDGEVPPYGLDVEGRVVVHGHGARAAGDSAGPAGDGPLVKEVERRRTGLAPVRALEGRLPRARLGHGAHGGGRGRRQAGDGEGRLLGDEGGQPARHRSGPVILGQLARRFVPGHLDRRCWRRGRRRQGGGHGAGLSTVEGTEELVRQTRQGRLVRQPPSGTVHRVTCRCGRTHGTYLLRHRRELRARLRLAPPVSCTGRPNRRRWHCG